MYEQYKDKIGRYDGRCEYKHLKLKLKEAQKAQTSKVAEKMFGFADEYA